MITETIEIRHDLSTTPIQIRHSTKIDGVTHNNVFHEDYHLNYSAQVLIEMINHARLMSAEHFKRLGATDFTIIVK